MVRHCLPYRNSRFPANEFAPRFSLITLRPPMDIDATGKFVEAILQLARINDGEPGLNPNPREAFRWYKIAANLRSPYAQYCVATCYADGFGVAKDDVRYGRGVAQDDGETVGWLRKAAEQGLAPAQCDLADCCNRGRNAPGFRRSYCLV